MSTEEDTELRDLVIESLDKKGILGKIKAELRATVFLALEDTSLEKCKISFQNESLQKFMETGQGILTVSLIRDFLKEFNLDYTLAVFEPEVSLNGKYLSRKELASQLKVPIPEGKGSPIITSILPDSADKENAAPAVIARPFENLTKPKPSNDNPPLLESPKDDKSDNSDRNDDNFFDDPLPSNDKNSLLFSFLGKNTSGHTSNAENDFKSPEPPVQSSDHTFNKSEKKDGPVKSLVSLPDLSEKGKLSSALSSLKDLPSIVPDTVNAKRKGSDAYDDDFQSSKSPSLKSVEKDPDDTEPSIEEDIEEDISAAANDLLNSISSQADDLTLDQSISRASGGKPFDYVEKFS